MRLLVLLNFILWSFSFANLSHEISMTLSAANNKVDEQLYSRQIFVYGKSAQQQLSNAHVLVYGSGLLTAEILKNLALAGVGKISIIDTNITRIGPKSKLIGNEDDLLHYALSLNPSLSVSFSNSNTNAYLISLYAYTYIRLIGMLQLKH